MKKTIFAVFVLLTSIAFAQKITVVDTINATTMERFKVPAEKNIVVANVLKIKFNATLLDASMNPIRECKDFYQDPSDAKIKKKARGGRGTNVQYAVFETLEEEGIYYIKIDIKVKGERGGGKKTVYYMVDVKYPEIVAPIQLNEKGYYYSEHKSFSFATVQFNNPNLYSYKLFTSGGDLIEEKKGPIVELDSVLSDLRFVGQKIKIVGYYGGKPFKYREIGGSDVFQTEWEIAIRQPKLNEFTDWRRTDGNTKEEPVIISAYNYKAMRILYSYFGKTESGFVVVKPEIKGFSLSAEPKGLVINARPIRTGSWLYIQFELSQDYLDGIEEYGQVDVKLNVRFKTQFNERVNRTYDATIYK